MNAMLENPLPTPERLEVQSGNVRLAVWRWARRTCRCCCSSTATRTTTKSGCR